MPTDSHIVIVGGGAIGSAIASFAPRRSRVPRRGHVVERDRPTRARRPALSASSIRQQFSTAINVDIGLAASTSCAASARRSRSTTSVPASA
jgi:glycine/D-amino acid oxidase-like deaminating enzyme